MKSVQKLALVVVFGLTALVGVSVVYLVDEQHRQDARAREHVDNSLERAEATYIQFCLSCHGPGGEGFLENPNYIGWPLAGDEVTDDDPNLRRYNDDLSPTARNQVTFEDDPVLWENRRRVVYDALHRGRGVMPAWGEEFGGELNDEQIDELILLIQMGDWNHVFNHAYEYAGGVPTPPAPPGAAAASEGNGAPAEPAGDADARLDAIDIAWNQTELTVPVGGTIEMENLGGAEHNFVIVDYDPLEEDPFDLPVGGGAVMYTLPDDIEPGEYEYYCAVPGHQQLMRGTLIVEEAGG